MPSGVIRLRQSKKANMTKRWYPPADEICSSTLSETGDSKGNMSGDEGLAPKKSASLKGYAPNTKPPLGRALPVRGEHNANDRVNTQA